MLGRHTAAHFLSHAHVGIVCIEVNRACHVSWMPTCCALARRSDSHDCDEIFSCARSMSLDTHMQQTHMSCDEVLSSPTYRKSRHALPATGSLRLHTAASHAANTESHETNQYASKINLKCLARRPDMPPLAEQTKTLKNLHGLRQPVSFLVCARLWMSWKYAYLPTFKLRRSLLL